MQNPQPRDEFDAWCQQVKSILDAPGFQKVLEQIKSVPSYEALQIAFMQLTPQALALSGVELPEGTIISLRASQDATGPAASTTDSPIKIRAMLCLPFVRRWLDLPLLGDDAVQSPSW